MLAQFLAHKDVASKSPFITVLSTVNPHRVARKHVSNVSTDNRQSSHMQVVSQFLECIPSIQNSFQPLCVGPWGSL